VESTTSLINALLFESICTSPYASLLGSAAVHCQPPEPPAFYKAKVSKTMRVESSGVRKGSVHPFTTFGLASVSPEGREVDAEGASDSWL
jgi:hypothetical protein